MNEKLKLLLAYIHANFYLVFFTGCTQKIFRVEDEHGVVMCLGTTDLKLFYEHPEFEET